jgi:hypothetical protein
MSALNISVAGIRPNNQSIGPSGNHLRWAFTSQAGFPAMGFVVYRRISGEIKATECLNLTKEKILPEQIVFSGTNLQGVVFVYVTIPLQFTSLLEVCYRRLADECRNENWGDVPIMHLPLPQTFDEAIGRLPLNHINGYETEWDTARSASLLNEEQLWRKHPNMLSGLPPGDDVLVVRRTNARLEPAARYQLLVTGGDGGELLFCDRFDAGLLPEIWSKTSPAAG